MREHGSEGVPSLNMLGLSLVAEENLSDLLTAHFLIISQPKVTAPNSTDADNDTQCDVTETETDKLRVVTFREDNWATGHLPYCQHFELELSQVFV